MFDIKNLSTNKKTAVIIFTGLLTAEIIWRIYKKKFVEKSFNNRINVNEVIIFSDQLAECRMHAVSRIPCSRSDCSVKSLRKLVAYLESSKQKLDVCMYLLNCEDLAGAIVRSFLRGVVVRIIIDGGMASNSACDRRIREFQEKGIRVRMKTSEYLMHHKFAIVDEELIVTGSANWTMQALHGNWDNVIISNQNVFVKPFVEEFNRMWISLTEDED